MRHVEAKHQVGYAQWVMNIKSGAIRKSMLQSSNCHACLCCTLLCSGSGSVETMPAVHLLSQNLSLRSVAQ
jgi:hypothetical protein